MCLCVSAHKDLVHVPLPLDMALKVSLFPWMAIRRILVVESFELVSQKKTSQDKVQQRLVEQFMEAPTRRIAEVL